MIVFVWFCSILQSESCYCQNVQKGQLTVWLIHYSDSIDHFSFYYMCYDESLFHGDYLGFSNDYTIRDYFKRDDYTYFNYPVDFGLSEVLHDTLTNCEEVVLFSIDSVNIGVRAVTGLFEFSMIPLREYIPNPYRCHLSSENTISPFSVEPGSIHGLTSNEIRESNLYKIFKEYYYVVLGFVESEYMFFYDVD